MGRNIYSKKSEFDCSPEELFEWHEREFALERMSPPFDPVYVLDRKGKGIEVGAEVTIRMHAGPVPFKWKAQHTEYEKPARFADIQLKGPFSHWKHTHIVTEGKEGKAVLEDRIEYSLPFGFISNRLMKRNIESQLEQIFTYRHTTLKNDLYLHSKYGKEKKTILIAGASGQVGSALIPFLSTGGHRVIKLVRNKRELSHNELFWDPSKGILDVSKVGKIDVVINLSGENIGEGRWTDEKKEKIIKSRTDTTGLLVETILNMDDPPEVMISSSAIGYYGNTGEVRVNEESPKGTDFISDVCEMWEDAAKPVTNAGTRLILARIGVVCSPLGGALCKLLGPARFGFGGKLGDGTQHMSWLSMDDMLGMIYFFIHNKETKGVYNLCTEKSLSNHEMVNHIGKVLKKPTFFTVPSCIIKILFGQMGDEIVLSNMRVAPDRLIKDGYTFIWDDFDAYLKYVLGKSS